MTKWRKVFDKSATMRERKEKRREEDHQRDQTKSGVSIKKEERRNKRQKEQRFK
jgi:hypothetical protein